MIEKCRIEKCIVYEKIMPRGRGPSQTPKFLSPGPPSPWLPALLIGNRFLSVLRQTADFCRRAPAWQRL